MNKILITGSASFIGFHLVNSFLNFNFKVVDFDNFNDGHDIDLKLNKLNNMQ